MWNTKGSFTVFLCVILLTIESAVSLSVCEQKEKNLAVLDLAKESIKKAKNLQSTCVEGGKNDSSKVSECGAKEKVSAYLDVAMNLIEDSRKNYRTCDLTRNHKKIILLHKKPIDCTEVLENGFKESGVYTIWPKHRVLEGRPLKSYCDMDTDGGGWTVIQRRGPFSEKIDFYRDWEEYKFGFGNISEEFWIGNGNIFALTNQGSYSARFDMQTVEKKQRFATYSSFWIEDENAAYKLHFGNFNGTAGNGMTTEKNTKFSTKDRKHDNSPYSCAFKRKGGWWYDSCGHSNPNGVNHPGSQVEDCVGWKCMNWEPLTSVLSLLSIEIKIRPEN